MVTAGELASLASTIESMRQRIAAHAQPLASADHHDLMTMLYEAERSLLSALRHLERAQRLL